MARKTWEIPLNEPFEDGAGVKVTKLTMQEPSASDVFTIGAAVTWVKASGGMAQVENNDAIRDYAERMIAEPDALLAMRHMGASNALLVREKIMDFFRAAAAPKK
jgi:hypothetical protein